MKPNKTIELTRRNLRNQLNALQVRAKEHGIRKLVLRNIYGEKQEIALDKQAQDLVNFHLYKSTDGHKYSTEQKLELLNTFAAEIRQLEEQLERQIQHQRGDKPGRLTLEALDKALEKKPRPTQVSPKPKHTAHEESLYIDAMHNELHGLLQDTQQILQSVNTHGPQDLYHPFKPHTPTSMKLFVEELGEDIKKTLELGTSENLTDYSKKFEYLKERHHIAQQAILTHVQKPSFSQFMAMHNQVIQLQQKYLQHGFDSFPKTDKPEGFLPSTTIPMFLEKMASIIVLGMEYGLKDKTMSGINHGIKKMEDLLPRMIAEKERSATSEKRTNTSAASSKYTPIYPNTPVQRKNPKR